MSESKKEKILIFGDAVVPTGFCNVLKGIFDNLPKDKYDLHWLGINYYGDYSPEQEKYKLYVASSKGNLWGQNRIVEVMRTVEPDILFMLNDPWVIAKYLEEIKAADFGKKLPKIVVYFPIDSMFLNPYWFSNYDLVAEAYTYTNFGKREVDAVAPQISCGIIPHGTDINTFYKIGASKEDLKKALYTDKKTGICKEEYYDSWMVGSYVRNQPRKRLDLLIMGFALFSQNKPINVRLQIHAGLKDAGVGILPLSRRFGIEDRIHITSKTLGIQTVPTDLLNIMYNSTDLGANVSWGEG